MPKVRVKVTELNEFIGAYILKQPIKEFYEVEGELVEEKMGGYPISDTKDNPMYSISLPKQLEIIINIPSGEEALRNYINQDRNAINSLIKYLEAKEHQDGTSN